MAKGKHASLSSTTKTAFMFPRLHPDVASAVSGHIIPIWVGKRAKKTCNNDYETSVMGRFTCDNSFCPKAAWISGHVAIVIRGYPNNGYNAVVYNQRCQACKQLGNLTLDEDSYIERVSYRLKKWAGISMELPAHERKDTPPHREDLCEGCKQHRCKKGSGNRGRC
ncbi:hypothetical protein CKAH01_17303 [Colletotrichum kahawae]|uniref:3CxxC-type domain-containing protein n=1 Tax=Colletotrichum kahawae TaxID=34407 RepID=A0AAE0D732_COLKA|nr:hypothetical protein CKAH01_17303 [Colletotrichum kahawae]